MNVSGISKIISKILLLGIIAIVSLPALPACTGIKNNSGFINSNSDENTSAVTAQKESTQFDPSALPDVVDYDVEDPLGILGRYKGRNLYDLSEKEITVLLELANQQLIMPDEKTQNEILNTNSLFQKGIVKTWNELTDLKRGESGFRCYGIYNGCTILYQDRLYYIYTTITVAGVQFSHSEAFDIYAFSKGELITLSEAYKTGILSGKDIAIAAEYHKIVEAYIFKQTH